MYDVIAAHELGSPSPREIARQSCVRLYRYVVSDNAPGLLFLRALTTATLRQVQQELLDEGTPTQTQTRPSAHESTLNGVVFQLQSLGAALSDAIESEAESQPFLTRDDPLTACRPVQSRRAVEAAEWLLAELDLLP
jgi:hypothetical protein